MGKKSRPAAKIEAAPGLGLEKRADGSLSWIANLARESYFGKIFHRFAILCTLAAEKSGWKRLSLWMRAYFEPAASQPLLSSKATAGGAAINTFLAFFVLNCLSFAGLLLLSGTGLQDGIPNLYDPLVAAYFLLAEPLLNSASFLLTACFLLLCAGFLGGKGGYWGPAHALSFVMGGWQALLGALSLCMVVAAAAGSLAAGWGGAGTAVMLLALALMAAFSILSVAVSLYGLYSACRMTMAAFGLPPARAGLALAGAAAFSLALSIALSYALSGMA